MSHEGLLAEIRRHVRETARRPALALIAGTLLLVLYEYQGSSRYFREHLAELVSPSPFSGLYAHLYWYGSATLLLGVIPLLLLRFVARAELHEFGLQLGRAREGFALVGVALLAMLPVVALAAGLPEFQLKYPLCRAAESGLAQLLLYEAAYFFYYLSWEFFFRGFLLFSLAPAIGAGHAVLVQMVPFALLHVGKPELEAFASIAAGIALGLLALRTRSVLYCALLHGLVAWAMDAAVLTRAGRWPGLDG